LTLLCKVRQVPLLEVLALSVKPQERCHNWHVLRLAWPQLALLPVRQAKASLRRLDNRCLAPQLLWQFRGPPSALRRLGRRHCKPSSLATLCAI
jgi:hypothetical protein